MIPEVKQANKITSSYSNGAKVSEQITVSYPEIPDRNFICHSGNKWQPSDVPLSDTCLGTSSFLTKTKNISTMNMAQWIVMTQKEKKDVMVNFIIVSLNLSTN